MGLSSLDNHSSKDKTSESAAGLLYADFNQDYGCFSVGTESGFRIYNSDPFKEKMKREFEEGGIGNITMLYRSNFLALVGGGRNPQFPSNKVMIWDDSTRQIISELEFRSEVRSVLLRKDLIIVFLRAKCIVCTLEPQPQKLHAFETFDNVKGIGAVSYESESGILVFPGRQKGQIQVVHLNNISKDNNNLLSKISDTATTSYQPTISNIESAGLDVSTSNTEEIAIKGAKQALKPAKINIVVAHATALSALAISNDGAYVASASEKGTLIRVFSTEDGMLLYELRRGVDRANIFSIAFSSDSSRICVSSDKGTVHIFNLDANYTNQQSAANTSSNETVFSAQNTRGNKQSSLSFIKGLLPKYFSSEWSFSHFRVQGEFKCISGFSPNRDSVVVICANGVVEKYSIGPLKGTCTREWSRRYI
ncbi:hypothetical protein BB561_005254 [Smittium simulii]|uniref:Anaphase-promoting complex subunit 4 WD40 domain-containing protein n=1 Tax=Smittium simulii TaxID=133385 RepID=A0A2T9YBD1_9FUNG|nr:hypothetical protein BB561_005254 [Smittium simulii]